MKNTVFIIALYLIFPIHILSQNSGDTITVQTLSSLILQKRRGWYIFPKDTNQYHKILMYYTLKCDAATTQDNYPCGNGITLRLLIFSNTKISIPHFTI